MNTYYFWNRRSGYTHIAYGIAQALVYLSIPSWELTSLNVR